MNTQKINDGNVSRKGSKERAIAAVAGIEVCVQVSGLDSRSFKP